MMMATGAGISLILTYGIENQGRIIGSALSSASWQGIDNGLSCLGTNRQALLVQNSRPALTRAGKKRASGWVCARFKEQHEEEIRGENVARRETPKGRRGRQGRCSPRHFGDAASGGEG
jgi:hypothetical protein